MSKTYELLNFFLYKPTLIIKKKKKCIVFQNQEFFYIQLCNMSNNSKVGLETPFFFYSEVSTTCFNENMCYDML